MKSQSNSQELKDVLERYERTRWKALEAEDYELAAKATEESKAKLLELALSCLPERWGDSYKYQKSDEEIEAHNVTIDTMEQNINLKFGGSDV